MYSKRRGQQDQIWFVGKEQENVVEDMIIYKMRYLDHYHRWCETVTDMESEYLQADVH